MDTQKNKKPYRILTVFFDLYETTLGNRPYNQVNSALSLYGTTFRSVKQIRLVITQSSCKIIQNSIAQKLSHKATVLVAFLKNIPNLTNF